MSIADQAMGAGLRALNRFAGLEVVDRVGLRDPAERLVYRATRNGFKAANAAGRTFAAAQRLSGPARQARPAPSHDLFDLTPTDEQQMIVEAFGDFAESKLRKAATVADRDCAAPSEILAQANELGVGALGVPEELGGAFAERSAVTSVLVTESLAHGDPGLAVAILAPAAVSTAISLWGDADQQSTYLPEFSGENPPAAALALLEPRALFDPFELETKARKVGSDYVIDGAKALVPRAADAELFVIAADLEGAGPALFIVEAKAEGVLLDGRLSVGGAARDRAHQLHRPFDVPDPDARRALRGDRLQRLHRAGGPHPRALMRQQALLAHDPFGVTAPTSTKPNPAATRAPTASAFLSNPAASPSGLASSSPASRARRRSWLAEGTWDPTFSCGCRSHLQGISEP